MVKGMPTGISSPAAGEDIGLFPSADTIVNSKNSSMTLRRYLDNIISSVMFAVLPEGLRLLKSV